MNKKFLKIALAFCLILPAMFMLSACGAKKSVVGSWETYQVIVPAEKEGGEDTIINLGDPFAILNLDALSKDTYNLTVTDKDISLTIIMGEDNTVATGAGTYTETDGVYSASIIVSDGKASETFKTTSSYDKGNDKLSCKIIYYEDEVNTYYYTLILTRVNGK